jgi:hypothetical protein
VSTGGRRGESGRGCRTRSGEVFWSRSSGTGPVLNRPGDESRSGSNQNERGVCQKTRIMSVRKSVG